LLTSTTEPFSGSWPRAGIASGGTVSRRAPLAPLTRGIDSGLLPTPAAVEYGSSNNGSNAGRPSTAKPSLNTWAHRFPTPRNTDGDRGGRGDLLQSVRGNPNSHYKMWPTPHGICVPNKRRAGPSGNELGRAVNQAQRMWPTPTGNDTKPAGKVEVHEYRSEIRRTTVQRLRVAATEPDQIGGALNPTWVEWLMGWPLGWTALEPLGMDKCRNASLPPGGCFQEWLEMNRMSDE
jgi:hypothetical protein